MALATAGDAAARAAAAWGWTLRTDLDAGNAAAGADVNGEQPLRFRRPGLVVPRPASPQRQAARPAALMASMRGQAFEQALGRVLGGPAESKWQSSPYPPQRKPVAADRDIESA